MPLQQDIEGDYTRSAYRDESRDQSNVYVRFKMMTVEDAARTAEEGRACFKDIEVMEAMQVGSKNAVTVKPVDDLIKRRWAKQYAAWKEGQEEPVEGTPLAEWPLMTRAMVEELAYLNVRTVEDLISMPDNAKQQIMGIQGLVAKAKDWLERSDGSLVQLREENTKLKVELDTMKDAFAKQQAQIDELAKKRVRRTPKDQLEDAAS